METRNKYSDNTRTGRLPSTEWGDEKWVEAATCENTSPVNSILDRVSFNSDNLNEIMYSLEKRLDQILSPSIGSGIKEDEYPRKLVSPLAEKLESVNDRILNATATVNRIISRLEI